jgi:heme/copper-type cytochrome/quinol oxidase subunit 3
LFAIKTGSLLGGLHENKCAEAQSKPRRRKLDRQEVRYFFFFFVAFLTAFFTAFLIAFFFAAMLCTSSFLDNDPRFDDRARSVSR